MCQHSRDGGNRCPVHRHDSAAIVKIATHESNLLPKQMDNLFSELRREGRSAAAPTETEWKAKLDELEADVKDTDIGENVINKLNKARQHSSLPDGATAYAQNLLVSRAKTRATNLDNKLREIAGANGLTLAQARAKFVEEYNTVDRSRGADVPPEYTQMSRRRAVQAGIPYDRSTVVALARVAVASERGPRRVERVPATGSSYISEYGYNEDGGRFEIVFRNNPDAVFAYHNVPESTWERMNSSHSAGSIYAREIRGHSEFMYDSAEEAEADAHQVRCTSCGQFRASAHACPRREASDELAEQGFNAATIEEIVDVIAPALIDNTLDQEPEENPAPTVADSVPAVVYAEEEISEETPEESPTESAETPRRHGRGRATSVETEAEVAEPVVEEPVFIPEPVGILADSSSVNNNPALTLRNDTPISIDYVPTAETQRHPVPLVLSEGVELQTVHEVDSKFIAIVGKGREHLLVEDNAVGSGFTEAEREEIKLNIAAGIKYVIGHSNGTTDGVKSVVLEKYDPKVHSLDVITNGGWYSRRDIKSKYQVRRIGRRVSAEPISRDTKIDRTAAETRRLAALVAEGKAVVVDHTATMTRKYKVDGNRAINPRISFGAAASFRRAIKEGKTVITKTSWEMEDNTGGCDDQGYAYPSNGYRNQISGEVAIRRNAAGVMEVVSSEHTLKCTCSDYRRNYYCEHVNYVQRHVPNVAQQIMPAERTHRLLTAALAGRADISVIDDGKTPAYISFGTEAPLNGPGSTRALRGNWIPYTSVSIPADMISSYADPTDEDITAVYQFNSSVARQVQHLGAPPNLAGVHQALRRADVSIPVAAQFDYNGVGSLAGTVTGTMMIHRDADNENLSVTSHTLKCTCAEYQEDYDCPHIRMAAGQPQMFLNIGARRGRSLDIDRSLASFTTNNHGRFRREDEIQNYMRRHSTNREDAVVAVDAERAAVEERQRIYREQREREEAEYRAQRAEREREERERIERENAPLIANLKTYRESMMKRWETQDEKYSDNPELFYNEYKESLARKRKGDEIIPFKLEGVTDGVCAPVPGARQFGVELEFDIAPGVDRRTALRKIGQELHAAGLTKEAEQTYYHAAARNGYEKWSYEQDCTVDAELVSPIMSDTPEHWKELQTAVEIITRNGGKATTRCGSHVHISTASYGASTAKHAELLRTVNQNEDVLYRLASDPSRGKHRGTKWCAPNVSDRENDVADDIQHGHNVLGSLESHNYGLNFEGTSKKQFMKSNIEFRMWDGTLDPAAIQQQVVVSAAITDYAERSVIENKGSKKPTEARKKIGHGREKEKAALSRAGTKTHTAESFTEANSHVSDFLDKLFRRNEDKAGVAALFAATNWQSDKT
jgi:hypothetical protein